jgi:rhomboid-like protein
VSSWQKSLNGYVPAFILTPVLRLKVAYENWRLNTPPGQVASMKVISVMGTVFLMWRLPRIRRTMDKWFLHRPVVFGLAKLHPWKQCVTLFTSTVSSGIYLASYQSLTNYGRRYHILL